VSPNAKPGAVDVGRKQDIRELEAIAKKFGMDSNTRREFGDYIEECKRSGERGSRNDRGDYTWAELEQKARAFLGQDPPH
jgi:hypothetical protein